MTAYDCFKEYLSLKNHFTKDSYDYFKYNGKVRTNLSSFEKRKDKIFFHKLAKHENVHGFLVANLVHNPKTWIKELAYSEEAERYTKIGLKNSNLYLTCIRKKYQSSWRLHLMPTSRS
jgi:hypothetical protein